MNAIDLLLTNIDASILGFVQGSFGAISPAISALWHGMFIVFFAVYGYKIVISGRFMMSDILVHIFRFIIILVLATSWTEFQIFIMDIVTGIPADIAGAMLQNGAGVDVVTANTALGEFYESSMQVSSNIMEGAGWNVTIMTYSWAVWLSALALTAYALMLIVLAKVAVAVILSVGPFFILMLVFTQSKSLFEGWLRTLLNYALIPIFVYGLLALLLGLIAQPLTALENNVTSTSEIMTFIAPFMLVSFVSVLLLAQVMHMASSITGGISLSTMGMGRAAARPLGRGSKTVGTYGRTQGERGVERASRTGKYSQENRVKRAMPFTKTGGKT
ncbi:MAG: hypothetical protein COB14_07430 [Alphaproteobacteria bacterium]|nr:MAG: hypothetical protein COB14_07430 [Alphaproteobacteria bacterium]